MSKLRAENKHNPLIQIKNSGGFYVISIRLRKSCSASRAFKHVKISSISANRAYVFLPWNFFIRRIISQFSLAFSAFSVLQIVYCSTLRAFNSKEQINMSSAAGASLHAQVHFPSAFGAFGLHVRSCGFLSSAHNFF